MSFISRPSIIQLISIYGGAEHVHATHRNLTWYYVTVTSYEQRYFTKHRPTAGCCQRARPSPRQLRLRRNGPLCCWMPSLAAFGLRDALQCIVNGEENPLCWPWPLTLTFKLVRARDQARLLCEFGANPFSGSRYIWSTDKKVTHSAKTEPYLRAVINRIVRTTRHRVTVT